MTEKNPGLLAHHFAEFLAQRAGLDGEKSKRFYELVVELSSALEQGHSCLPLKDSDLNILRITPLVADRRDKNDTLTAPLVLCEQRLYLHRYYTYERRLARQILSKIHKAGLNRGEPAVEPLIRGMLEHLFPKATGVTEKEKDYQKEAARMALHKSFVVISGGPGTGKTSTVVKILALLVCSAAALPSIGLAAPTGKAAMRLSESIGKSLAWLELDREITGAIPTVACTLHRLLGVRRNSPQFIHNRENPMGWDIVVVDEASMVDLAMMSKLVDALKPGAKLILLGDRDQLASVESGTVLSDFVESLPENSITLQKSYRFDANIKQLAEAVNEQNPAKARALLHDPNVTNVGFTGPDLMDYITNRYAEYMQIVIEVVGEIPLQASNIKNIFRSFQNFQLLCAIHFGENGVMKMNSRVESNLSARGYSCRTDSWYPGRPILITRNDYGLDLFNGDIGICLPDPKEGSNRVWFEKPNGTLKSILPSRLPPYETVFAMTIHKSQGSEFDEVVVLLPEEDNRILSRELIYTGVTRAKKAVRLVAQEKILDAALQRNVERHSGLRGFLENTVL